MKRFPIRPSVLLLTLLCLALAPALSAQDTYSGEKSDSIEVPGISNFQIELDGGFNVRMRGVDTQTISYSYSFSGNRLAHERNFTQADFRLERRGTTALLEIRFPELDNIRQNSNQTWLQRLFNSNTRNLNIEKQELIIEMPREIAVRLGTRYSDLDISGVGRDLNVTTRSGTISVSDVGGNLSVSNEYGNTTARNVEGETQVNSRSSDITLENIRGRTNVSAPYSDIHLSGIRGAVRIQTQSGSLEADRIEGTLEARGDYSTMNIREVDGAVTVHSRSGELSIENVPKLAFAGEYTDITAHGLSGTEINSIQNRSATVDLRNVNGGLQISGEYLEVRLEDIRSELEIENRSGSVSASQLMRSATVMGEYLDINLNSFAGSVLRIQNRSGDTDVESTGSLSQVDIQVAYGDVNISMQEEYVGPYSLQTRYGELNLGDSSFDVDMDFENPDARNQTVSGQIGTGTGNRFQITTRNGDITVTLIR